MRKIISFSVAFVIALSVFTCVSTAVTYTDLEPTYSLYNDYEDFANDVTDTNLGFRANCYGYAMRLHYGRKNFPVNSYGVQTTNYRQVPGEFYDKSDVNIATYQGLIDYYGADYNGDSKPYDVDTVFQFIRLDCNELGYSVSFVGKYEYGESFTPPDASASKTQRLVALVERADGSDVHFYMQSNDNRWTHKPASFDATYTCGSCQNSDGSYVSLTNANISSHISHKTMPDAVKSYNGNVILFYIDAPGSADRYHLNGHYSTAPYTVVDSTAVPGDYIYSASPKANISSETINGRINYIDDEDFYIYNVTSSGKYNITFSKGTTYEYILYTGEVTDSFSLTPTYMTILEITTDSLTLTKTLEAGKRYYIRVIASGQTEFDDSMSYTIQISPKTN